MGPHEAPHLNYSEDLWINWFVDGIINSDVDDIGAKAILHYLIDLNVLEVCGDGLFKLSELQHEKDVGNIRRLLSQRLNRISQTKRGFALIYFISDLQSTEFPPLKSDDSLPERGRKNIFGKNILADDSKSSNLSNLQIVKKWGDNLRPFLDLEQQTIARLEGVWTSRENAQWLFSYILNKTRVKSPAKKWEQLSRKRHR